MATTTFHKTIVLESDAAERLADALEQPATPLPADDDDFWERNGKRVKEWLLRSKS